jgi:L-ascorbate 6-phosphate lactonase
MSIVPLRTLGQSGFRLQFGDTVVYIDPYLTDSCATFDGPHLARLAPPPLAPSEVTDADFVFVTHAHRDHCDPDTLVPLARASPKARFVASSAAAKVLAASSIARERVELARESWTPLAEALRVRAVPAAHPVIERDTDGVLLHAGYIFEFGGRRFYHSGDTSLTAELLEALSPYAPIDIVFLPVNERNFVREQQGILANMSLREAFYFAAQLGARTLVPMHWDLFGPNSTFRDEIELVHRLAQPELRLELEPSAV